jgi:hypothetical protein
MRGTVVTEFGVCGMFAHWPVYALAAAGLGAEVVYQTTLRAGPLSVSQPLLVTVNPIVSIALSVWIFQEHCTPDAARLAAGSAAFAAMCAVPWSAYLDRSADEVLPHRSGRHPGQCQKKARGKQARSPGAVRASVQAGLC